MDHRKPPLPEYYHSVPPGTCRWCNQPTRTPEKPKRTRWHSTCLVEYKSLFWPSFTRKLVLKRDKGKCASCETHIDTKQKNSWHVDHIQPLIEAKGNIDFWKLSNLQTLCKQCHIDKTVIENKERSRKKKSDDENIRPVHIEPS